MGNGGYGQFITRCLCCSFLLRRTTPHTLPLLQREVPSHGRQFSTDFSKVSPSHELPHSGILPTGCSPSGTGCSSMGPPWGHKPCQQTCSSVGSSLHRSTGPGRSLIQCGLPMGSQPPSGIQLLRCGVFHRLRVDLCSTMDLHGLQGDNLPHHGLHHELQGKTLCSDVSSTSSPSFFTDLGVCRVVSLTSSHSSLLTAISPWVFFPFLNILSQRCYHHR